VTLSVDEVRGRFPALRRTFAGRPLNYLDSAATSLKVDAALEAERRLLEAGAGNIHRGKHALSEEASDAYERARDTVARFIGAGAPAEVVFVRNTTEALNVVAHGLALAPTDEVVATTLEHHSNLLPWQSRATMRWVKASPFEPVTVEAVAESLTPGVKVLALSLASNVTGVVQPVQALCALARERGVVSVVDAAQAVAHLPIDVGALGCDFLAFSGHKVYGPTGVGVLYGRSEVLERLRPLLLGGGTVDRVTTSGHTLRRLPHRLEAGTPHISGAVGLAAALEWLSSLPMSAVAAHSAALADRLADLVRGLPGVRVLQASAAPRVPLATLVLDGPRLSADDVAVALSDRYGVMVRSGFHCAHPLFAALGVQQASFRVSAGVYTLERELTDFVQAVQAVLAPFLRR
jgi:cysteine desulfurase/selenocysteine lyase